MDTSDVNRIWENIGGAFWFNQEAFQNAASSPHSVRDTLIVVLIAGLSLAVGQSIILFINQVKPLRFVFSLLISAFLFAFGFLFLVFSTWLITLLPWSTTASLPSLTAVLGLSYVPLLFSFLGALPYLGMPILNILSIWNLLLMVFGFSTLTGVSILNAFGYVVFGWIVLQLLQQTIGQPIAKLGQRLANTVAGVDLETTRRGITNIVNERAQASSTVWKEELQDRMQELRSGNLSEAILGDGVLGNPETAGDRPPTPLESVATAASATIQTTDFAREAERGVNTTLKTILGLLGMAVLTCIVVIALRPVREAFFGWVNSLPALIRLIFGLTWVGVIAVVVAGLLAPLETLGWWAGWYEDEVDTTINAGELAEPVSDASGISRFIVYLDGIGISSFEYLPDIEEFLDTLAPALPDDMALLRGIIPYSVLNSPLDEDRPLSFLWRAADKARFANPMALLGLLVNIRNVMIVAVSADKRYGPLYNQGIAQVVYNGLLKNGYQPASGTPITLIGYSGGGQMSCACAPFLKRALSAPIDVISLGGVISANCNLLKLEHLYHLVGEKDSVERIGPVMFPGRWKLFFLSFWNRAKRRGEISFINMGPVGHQVPGGILDPNVILADGRSSLQQTIETITGILKGEILPEVDLSAVKTSNYSLYRQAAFNQYSSYPIQHTVDSTWYQPIGEWMGRLILPAKEERSRIKGTLFEVHYTPPAYQHLVGQVVDLTWVNEPRVNKMIAAVTHDVHFSVDAEYSSKYGGSILPDRLNHWLQVNPLESLAGSHPIDDLIVMLDGEVYVEPQGNSESAVLRIRRTPVEITGRYYALVQIQGATGTDDRFQVIHFNRATRQFDGLAEEMRFPQVVFAEAYGSYPSTMADIERSPLNETGWYVYGAKDTEGVFVVQSIGPRALFQLRPDQVVFGEKAGYRYIRKEAWANIAAQKGKISSVLCSPKENGRSSAIQDAIDEWKEGDRALLVHVYGGIGGNKKEPAAATPIFFGHFAYGLARVIRDPLADELRFDLQYYQVYTQNTDGLTSGILHWSRYLGDRQFGWLGTRPTCDLLIKLDPFTNDFDFDGLKRSALTRMLIQLEVMAARYRIGDGTGGTYVGPANNCSQDSNQALFASIQQTIESMKANDELLIDWANRNPDQADRLKDLTQLGKDLKLELQPFGKPRADWEKNEYNLGSTIEDQPIRNLVIGLSSWRTLLPRKASDMVVKVFLDYGATVWVLRTNQVGGYDPDIEPIAPMTL